MKLLDKYVNAKDVEVLSKEISLSDMQEFNQYIETKRTDYLINRKQMLF